MRAIIAGVYAIEGLKTGRSYLVEGSDGVALIDTSSGGASGRIFSAIEASGHAVGSLRAIIATHYHFDHTGNVAELVARSGAALYVHADDAPYVDGRAPWMANRAPWGWMDRLAPKQYALKIDRVLRDGEMLPFAGGLRVIHAPGHTPGHIALHAKQARVLFAGDALMNIGGLRLPMAMASHDMDVARKSARDLSALDFDVALPGHGAPILGRASEKIAEWAKAWL